MATSDVPAMQPQQPFADDDASNLADLAPESTGKSSNTGTFDTDYSDLEDGSDRRSDSRHRRSPRTSWWHRMVVRVWKNISIDDLRRGFDQALLQDSFSTARRARRRKTWYNCCVFGGISGLTIL